jgi:hypothetical protein
MMSGKERILKLAASAALVALMMAACGPRGEKPGPEKAPPEPKGEAKAGPEKQVEVDPTLLAEGKDAWRGCAACHCATDSRIEEDIDWNLLNEVTTCIEGGKPAPRLRKAILAFLRHPDTLRPLLLGEDEVPVEGKGTGSVRAPATAGSAYLKADRASIKAGAPAMLRLYWGKTPDGKSLTLPSGEYKVINYWLYRKTGEGKERWMATATNVDGCVQLYVETGEEMPFEVNDVLYGDFSCEVTEEGYKLNFSIHDMGGNRITLSKNGRIVMPGFRVLGPEGRVIVEDTFNVL